MGSLKVFFGTTIIFASILCFYNTLFPNDPINYTVQCIDCKNRVFKEKQSFFTLTSSDSSFSIIDSANQKVISKKKNGTASVILLKTGIMNPQKSGSSHELYLENTLFLNLTSHKIIKAAESIPQKGNILKNVESFVYNYIDKPTMGIPFLPAKDILTEKSGDCTEYSILSISMLRSLKIPARAVVGMIYAEEFQGRKNVFVYHMWVEAFYKNRWHLLDATNAGTVYPNRYIAFTYHSLKTESPLSYMRAISAIQDLKVQYTKK